MNWNNITLNKWKDIERIFNTTYEDQILQSADLISVVFDIDDPMAMTPSEFQKKIEELSFLKEDCPKNKLANSYILNGTKYVFNGNTFEMTMAQLIDFRAFSTKDKIDYADCLSVFLIPEGKKYNEEYNIEDALKDIGSLPLPDALELFTYFREGFHLYIVITIDYLNNQLQKMGPKTNKKEILEDIQKLKDLENTIYSRTH